MTCWAGWLTRTTSSPATTVKFEWDGWDCIREYTTPSASGSSGVTLYYVVNGELMAFDRDHVTYHVHADALGSVRMVTGPDGTVLARFDYDAWGNLLDSSYDDVPGGVSARYVGALGVRWDAMTGLYYMRHRWYDPGMGRFISRDPVHDVNRYKYALCDPIRYTDPSGREVIVRWADGTEVRTSSSEDLAGIIRQSKEGSITEIVFRGHGSPTSTSLNTATAQDQNELRMFVRPNGDTLIFLDHAGRPVAGRRTTQKWGLRDVLKGRLAKHASIRLEACNTATGDENIAMGLSKMFPEAIVTGVEGAWIEQHHWYGTFEYAEKRIRRYEGGVEVPIPRPPMPLRWPG